MKRIAGTDGRGGVVGCLRRCRMLRGRNLDGRRSGLLHELPRSRSARSSRSGRRRSHDRKLWLQGRRSTSQDATHPLLLEVDSANLAGTLPQRWLIVVVPKHFFGNDRGCLGIIAALADFGRLLELFWQQAMLERLCRGLLTGFHGEGWLQDLTCTDQTRRLRLLRGDPCFRLRVLSF